MVLFRNRIFNLAVAISILWHLFWICGIRIGLDSYGGDRQRGYPIISFLGPILEESTFRKRLKIDLSSFIRTPFRKGLIPDQLDLRKELLDKEIQPKEEKEIKEITTRRQAGVLDKYALIDLFDLSDGLNLNSHTQPDYPARIGLEGPAKNRIVLYSPPLPSLPDWAKREGLKFDLKVKFWISPQGVVKRAEPQISCGYPEVDLLGIRYISKWRFETVSADSEGTNQWGAIKLSLE
jgi:hypothetical protein